VKTEQLILSIGTILLAAHVFGWIFQRIGQPRVVGEMTAGFLGKRHNAPGRLQSEKADLRGMVLRTHRLELAKDPTSNATKSPKISLLDSLTFGFMGNVEPNTDILGERSEGAVGVGLNDYLSAEQAENLTDELEALTKKQAEAREMGIYVRPTSKEMKDFDARQARISAISVELRNNKR
jgi:hypothetical protein